MKRRRSRERALAYLLVACALGIFEGMDRAWSVGTLLAIAGVFLALVLLASRRTRETPPPPPSREGPAGRARSW